MSLYESRTKIEEIFVKGASGISVPHLMNLSESTPDLIIS